MAWFVLMIWTWAGVIYAIKKDIPFDVSDKKFWDIFVFGPAWWMNWILRWYYHFYKNLFREMRKK